MWRQLNHQQHFVLGDQIEIKENRFTVGDIDQFERTGKKNNCI